MTALLSDLDRTTDSRKATQILRRLALLGSPEAFDALLEAFTQERVPLKGLGSVWLEVLSEFDDPRVGPAVLEFLDRGLAEKRFDKSNDLTALWRLAITKLGAKADGAVLARLTDASLPANSTFKLAVLDAISGQVSPEVRSAVAEYLRNSNAVLSAFQALIRIGDSASQKLAFQHLLTLGPHAVVVSKYFGPRMTDTQAETLRNESASDSRLAAVYLVATAHAGEERIRQEAAFVGRALTRALTHASDDTEAWVCRTFSSRAVLQMAAVLADPGLVELFRQEAERSEVGRENLLRAARRMERALAKK